MKPLRQTRLRFDSAKSKRVGARLAVGLLSQLVRSCDNSEVDEMRM